ncbi:tautomerase family protein, partial [Pseudomonas marginalis]
VISRPRTDDAKVKFYQLLAHGLQEKCGIESRDVVVSVVTNTDADWSFGFGRAQFLTGEL